MSAEYKEVVLVSASPRLTDKSASEWFSSLGEIQLKEEGIHISRINVRKSISENRTESDFKTMLHGDALVFIFPLYVFCLPGMLMRFLQDFYQYYNQHKDQASSPKVYAVVNCGFPEPDINDEAVRVIRSFSDKINASFRFGILIGGGPMIDGAKDAPFMKRTLTELDSAFILMKRDILDVQKSVDNVVISVRFPRKLYFFMGGKGWVSLARKNGLKKRDLYRRPYRE